MSKKLTSVFTDNMDACIFTGSHEIERHHIFGGAYRMKSEQYGFVVPLRPDLHPNGAQVNQKYSGEIDRYLKNLAQSYFEKNYGSRADFIQIFGKSHL